MKKYYISPVIGDGLSPETSWRPKLMDIPGVNCSVEIKSDPTTGHPLLPWALCIVSGTKHGLIMADKDNRAMPDVSLDIKVTAINAATKSKMIADLQSWSIDTTFIGGADGYRDIIRTLGITLNPNFNENMFDVSE